MPDPRKQKPPQGSKAEVRLMGAFFAIGAGILVFVTDRDLAFGGIMPAWWMGILIFALGIAMLLFPSATYFREGAGRISSVGNRALGRSEDDLVGKPRKDLEPENNEPEEEVDWSFTNQNRPPTRGS